MEAIVVKRRFRLSQILATMFEVDLNDYSIKDTSRLPLFINGLLTVVELTSDFGTDAYLFVFRNETSAVEFKLKFGEIIDSTEEPRTNHAAKQQAMAQAYSPYQSSGVSLQNSVVQSSLLGGLGSLKGLI